MAQAAEIETDPFLVGYQAGVKAERERCAKVIRPLLDHYLNCYDGNKDALAIEAEQLLSK